MASPNRPGLQPDVPGGRYAAPMGTGASLPERMLQHHEFTSSALAADPASVPGSPNQSLPSTGEPASPPPPQRIPRWLIRFELFLRVMLRMYIGLFVCYMPWWPTFWDQNPLFVQFPTLSIYAANGAVRGLVSGLGLLNLWIAFHEAVRRRDR
jgi:hypothetical protein